jgi:hypothetical protein
VTGNASAMVTASVALCSKSGSHAFLTRGYGETSVVRFTTGSRWRAGITARGLRTRDALRVPS